MWEEFSGRGEQWVQRPQVRSIPDVLEEWGRLEWLEQTK